MRISIVLLQLLQFLIPPFLILNVYVYLYPAIHGCQFPVAKRGQAACKIDGTPAIQDEVAPFRLLAFGDPQLEGDSSLPDLKAPVFPSLHGLYHGFGVGAWSDVPMNVGKAVTEFGEKDIPRLLYSYRKRLDLLGNDYYLAHIYWMVKWWTQPTHMVVLGDLLGSQWIRDEEFGRRSDRFWKRVFKGAKRVPDELMLGGSLDEQGRHHTGVEELLGSPEALLWKNRLINVAGNHDIGYAGDIDENRIQRFEDAFGKVNWHVQFQLPPDEGRDALWYSPGQLDKPPELRLIILNDMNLDSPALRQSLQNETTEFMDWVDVTTTKMRPSDATILLTHIPLYKEEGICKDGPFFDYFPSEQGGGIHEQNHLTAESSEDVLNAISSASLTAGPKSRPRSIILNGHDHEGCESFHFLKIMDDEREETGLTGTWQSENPFFARQYLRDNDVHGIREITVRSMMGSFNGNTGLLSAWFDEDEKIWKFEYATCPFAVQHVWWGVHIFDFCMVLLGAAVLGFAVLEARSDMLEEERLTRIDPLKKKM